MNDYGQIVSKITSTDWLITLDSLSTILDIVDRRIEGETIDEDKLAEFQGGSNREELELPDKPSVAVLPIHGPMFGKANLMTKMSGASSTDKLRSDFKKLVESDKVTSIILDIDSPGGSSELISEFGDDIYAARDKKPVIAFANTQAGSGALWLGSQASKFYSTKSGRVGSVGAYTVHTDESGKLEKEGLKKTIIHAGRFKVAGNPYEPLSEDGKNYAQERIDELNNEFHEALARGRGVSTDIVAQTYGEGKMFSAKIATQLGMIDGVRSFDEILSEVSESGASESNKETESVMDGFAPETLEALGLGEEATIEEINAAVIQMASDFSELAPLKEVNEKAKAFAETFPEEAAKLARLEESDRQKASVLFTRSYEHFTSEDNGETGLGFSGLALEQVSEMHYKISTGNVSVDDFKAFLDSIASGNAIVDYREHGSARGKETIEAGDSQEAGAKLVELAHAAVADAGGPGQLTFGDALAKVSREHPELSKKYQEAFGRKGGDS